MSFYSEFSEYYEETFPLREEVYRFLRSFPGNDGGKVLDLGCGPGHYCNRFQEDGFDATGVDSNREMITAARRSYPASTFHCRDIVDIDLPQGTFDLVYSIGNVLAHIPPEKLRVLLQTVGKLLKPDRYWIFQVVNWDLVVTKRSYTFPVKSLAGGRVRFHREYENITPQALLFHSTMKEGENVLFDEKVTLYPLKSDEYLKFHREAGFRLIDIYADFKKNPYKNGVDSGAVFVFSKNRSGAP